MIILFFIIIGLCVHYFIKLKFSHWTKKGVKGPAPLPFVGNFGKIVIQKQSISELAKEVYNQFPEEKVVGLYWGSRPALLLRDPEIINYVMTTDFNNFVNRGIKTTERGFNNNLFASEDSVWRNIRQKLTPAFTSKKLKQMAPLTQETINKFIKQVDIFTDSQENCDVKELAARFAMDLICSCGFGLNLDLYLDEMQEIIRIGKNTVTPSLSKRLWYAAELLIPGLHRMLPVVDPSTQLRNFFINLVNHVINERKKLCDTRHDIMEVMINLLEKDKNKQEGAMEKTELKIDVNFIASQIYILYVTGYETISYSLSFLLYELAMHEDIQETAYKEIRTILHKNSGKLTYESVNEMTYLRKVFNETLRMHTVLGWIVRKASKDYTIPTTNIKIKAGTMILVSVSGLHNDPKYFENPDVFNPETFSAENFSKIPQCAFIPFGFGPRNCIGLRFGTQHVMMAAATFLSKFKVSPCTDQQRKMKFDSISISSNPVDGVWIKISKRN